MAKILGVTDDSRKVKPGYVFVAIKGGRVDGHDFISQAIENGASTIYGERDMRVMGAKYVKVADTREKLGELASEFYGDPSDKLKVIGVTGTKGKTTTAYLIYHILSAAGKKVGIVSSIVAKVGDLEIDTGFHVTSPDVVSLQKFIRDMVLAGCEYAVIEVSSHGIDQKRVAGVKFEIGVLTNIAPEHLDYHKTFGEYKRVKKSFINSCKFKVIAPDDTDLNILPGKFNNLNAEAAIKTVGILGIDRKKSLELLRSFKLPKGRLEEVKNSEGFRIVIDFAHTPDSLEASLKYLRTLTPGRLIAVFGCAGERDVAKRGEMGRISGELADYSVFTAEDPRSEDIGDIFRLMKSRAKNYICIPERGEAIAYALSIAGKGDLVAFLGKGHEKNMAYVGFEHPWSDKEEVENFLKRKNDISSIILAGGKGTRMKSDLPKILNEIGGRPMIAYTLQNLRRAKVEEIITVVSFKRSLVVDRIAGAVKIAVQKNAKGGTGDATASGIKLVGPEAKNVLVLYGDDTAFYTPQTIEKVIDMHTGQKSKLTFITLIKDNPQGLGRIIRDASGDIAGIVEEKNASGEQKKIREINDGLYVFDRQWLNDNLPKIEKNKTSGEYYLVDLIKIAIGQGQKVIAYKLPNSAEWQGINTPEELEKAKKEMEAKLK